MIDHRRPESDFLPCDTEPPLSLLQPSPEFRHADGCDSTVSAPLCACRRRRKLPEALVDVGERRGLNLRQTVELVTPPGADIVCLAQERAIRARRRRHA